MITYSGDGSYCGLPWQLCMGIEENYEMPQLQLCSTRPRYETWYLPHTKQYY
jgi:hypothetical protein